jgi:ABC-2 type transport system ATP-binding protein
MAMLEIQELSRHFGPIRAVDGVSFDVERGEVLGFLGPNGAGKSTTMKMVTGFLAPTSGTIRVCGVDVRRDPIGAKKQLGYLPEGAPAYPDMTPLAFLRFIGEIRELKGAKLRSAVDDVISRVHLEGVLRQPIETLSKGFKRRVGLAQAILHDPPVLVLDEPTDGLDPNQKHEVRDLIGEISADKAIVLSTHILEEVDAICSRALIINRGRLVADGTPGELQARSRMHNAVTLRLAEGALQRAGGKDGVKGALASVAGVSAVEQRDVAGGTASFVALSADGGAIVEAVSLLARDRSWEVAELHVEIGRLDEVFRDVTTSDTVSGVFQ